MVNRVALSLFLNVRVWVYCRRCRGAPVAAGLTSEYDHTRRNACFLSPARSWRCAAGAPRHPATLGCLPFTYLDLSDYISVFYPFQFTLSLVLCTRVPTHK